MNELKAFEHPKGYRTGETHWVVNTPRGCAYGGTAQEAEANARALMNEDPFEIAAQAQAKKNRVSKQTARESTIYKAILKWLNDLPGCKAIKIHGSEHMEAGTPDIMGCYHGRTFFIETKRPGEKPTPIQNKRLSEWQAAGAAVMVAFYKKDVQEWDFFQHR